MESNQEKQPVEFSSIRGRLETILQEKIRNGELKLDGMFVIVEGFFYNAVLMSLQLDTYLLGGPTVITVAIIHGTTGEMKFFALKALMPDLFKK